MTKLSRTIALCFASTALAIGVTACGGSDKTTTPASSTDQMTQSATQTETTPPTTTDADPNGVPPVTPASGTTQAAKCPSSAPQYDAATGLCYPNGAKMPE